jgi:hypothetical protein
LSIILFSSHAEKSLVKAPYFADQATQLPIVSPLFILIYFLFIFLSLLVYQFLRLRLANEKHYFEVSISFAQAQVLNWLGSRSASQASATRALLQLGSYSAQFGAWTCVMV